MMLDTSHPSCTVFRGEEVYLTITRSEEHSSMLDAIKIMDAAAFNFECNKAIPPFKIKIEDFIIISP